VTIRRARPDEAHAIADVYLRARRAAVPAIPPGVHDDDDVRRHFAMLVEEREVWVAEDEAIVGLLVLHDDDVDQLYLEPNRTGEGIGSALVEHAKAQRPEGLQLWAFQSNTGARRFYERHGFVADRMTDGDNEEGAPDVHYWWRPADRYTHGHHESVLRSHTARTAENSAAYLLPHLRAGQRLLDVGCGPGTITVDLAARVAPGEVIGIDRSEEVIAAARSLDAPANVRFEVGDVYALAFEHAAFDVVHAHQVLQHLSDPVGALRELRRVLRPGGRLAVRDSDYGAFTWAPASPPMRRWLDLYHELTRRNRAEADAGRYLLGWVQQAGFTDVVGGSSTWTFADPASRAWWCGLWADRIRQSAFADQALAEGLATRADLDELAGGFLDWAEHDDGWFVVLHGEVLATAP
jgi:ubiquinone/menaquinone biosynthesis C-methylase UbiE/GNAT superfamily N-acetyltransferase